MQSPKSARRRIRRVTYLAVGARDPSQPARARHALQSTGRWPHLAILSYALIGVGVGLRLIEFLENRSFSRDETFLALNIIGHAFSSFFQPLDFNQGAPIGFLASQKAISTVLGSGDQSLRLLPLTAAII